MHCASKADPLETLEESILWKLYKNTKKAITERIKASKLSADFYLYFLEKPHFLKKVVNINLINLNFVLLGEQNSFPGWEENFPDIGNQNQLPTELGI